MNTYMKTKLFLFMAGVLSLAGCREHVVVEPQPIVPIYRDVAALAEGDSVAADSLIHAQRLALKAMMSYLGVDSLTPQALEAWSRSRPVEVFTPAVDSVFPTLEPLERTLASILQRAEADSLDLPRRTYAAVVWGRMKSIVLIDTPADSVMLIALNHYLGDTYPGYGHWPSYMRPDKTPERLPYDIAEALVASKYPFRHESGNTILSRLLYEGALILAKLRLVPESNLADALGYTDAQLKWLEENEAKIWEKLVERKLLYDTSEAAAERLVSPSPATTDISPAAPGRIGRFVGYRILCAYMRSDAKTTLAEMLLPSFYENPSVLIDAAYEGR